MNIVCWQTILMKYHTLFFSKIKTDIAKFVVCCSRAWRFKGLKKDIAHQRFALTKWAQHTDISLKRWHCP